VFLDSTFSKSSLSVLTAKYRCQTRGTSSVMHCVGYVIIFNSPINGRQYKKTTQKGGKAVTTVTKHIDLTTQYQTQAMTIYYTDLQNALSHALYLIKKCSLWRARITLANSKAHSFWQCQYYWFLTVFCCCFQYYQQASTTSSVWTVNKKKTDGQ